MKRRIGMTAVVCCFGILMCLCASKTVEVQATEQNLQETMVAVSQAPDNIDVEKISGVEEEILTEETMAEETMAEETMAEETMIEETMAEETMTEAVCEETQIPQEEESEYASLAIADVSGYVNVRKEPNTDSDIVGKIYDGAVAQIFNVAGAENDWFQIISGNVEGYIKAEFFLYGEAAAEVIEEYVTRYAKVNADRLNVRKKPSTEADRIGYIDNGEKVKVLEDCGDWLRIQYTSRQEGYVAAEYVTIQEEFVYAKTLEEEQAEIAARQALEARQNVAESAVPEMLTGISFPATAYTSNEELRKSIVEYALQFVGNKYVHGGTGLASGTDCSGFTCFIYADFGYSISRTPGGQYSGAGRSIDYSEIQPGDIICYSSNGGKSCTHVALYIGDGQIVHAANSRKGVIIGAADYSPIIGIKNVID